MWGIPPVAPPQGFQRGEWLPRYRFPIPPSTFTQADHPEKWASREDRLLRRRPGAAFLPHCPSPKRGHDLEDDEQDDRQLEELGAAGVGRRSNEGVRIRHES